MRQALIAFLAAAAAGVIGLAVPAFAEIVSTPDGHYYRLVPVKAPPAGTEPEMVTVTPGPAVANIAPASNCRLVNFEDNEFQPEYTTVCGPQ
jgi:hypothetical protein